MKKCTKATGQWCNCPKKEAEERRKYLFGRLQCVLIKDKDCKYKTFL